MDVHTSETARDGATRVILIASLAEVLGALALALASFLVVHRLLVAYVSEVQAHEATKAAWRSVREGQSLPSYCGDRRD